VKGSDIILENFERKLDIKDGETTPDREFSIERVACVGCCALAPVTVVGETVYGHMAPSKVEGLVLQARMATEKLKSDPPDEGAESQADVD
jgi:NADH-quinone oxidoreductase subunit E